MIGNRQSTRIKLRDVPASVLSGWPYPLKRCDALGCDQVATDRCSSHGVHLCHRHFEDHREDWHVGTWERQAPIGRC